jgi:hypothetical protein
MNDTLAGLALGVPLLLLGLWGVRNASSLAPNTLRPKHLTRKAHQLRRGGYVLIVTGAVVLTVTVIGVFIHPPG